MWTCGLRLVDKKYIRSFDGLQKESQNKAQMAHAMNCRYPKRTP